MKKTMMFVRKLKSILNSPWPAEKTPFLRVFRATEARSRLRSVDTRDAGRVLARFARLKKSEKKKTFLRVE